MSWLNFGKDVAAPIDALGNTIDKMFTNDEERMQAQAVLDKIRIQPAILNAEMNKIEAQHRSLFVAGWRPCIGWICAAGIGFAFIGNPLLERFVPGDPVVVPLDMILELVLAMLGMGALRTFEKVKGVSK